MITVIFATRDDEAGLALSLSALVPAAVEGIIRDVVVVDSGSRDGTLAVAEAAGCTILRGTVGEAMIRAAEDVRGDWLLFLAPGSVLDHGWHTDALAFIDRTVVSGRGRDAAAAFRLGRTEYGLAARTAEWTAAFRSRVLAAPYAEQGLLISRSLYRKIGGHRTLPAMADVDLARRIGRRRLSMLRARAMVRGEGRRNGGFLRGIRNATCLAMFVMRLPPALIGRIAA